MLVHSLLLFQFFCFYLEEFLAKITEKSLSNSEFELILEVALHSHPIRECLPRFDTFLNQNALPMLLDNICLDFFLSLEVKRHYAGCL